MRPVLAKGIFHDPFTRYLPHDRAALAPYSLLYNLLGKHLTKFEIRAVNKAGVANNLNNSKSIFSKTACYIQVL